MNKNRAATAPRPSGRGRELAELRSGSRAGPHVKRRKDRANTRRRAIAYANI